MSRVFLDANILFSAAISAGGSSRAIFELGDQGGPTLIVTEYVMEEALTNLQAKRPASVSELLVLLDGIGFVPAPPPELQEAVEGRVTDPDDVPVLAGALYADADLLVTGNRKHFGKLYGEKIGGCLVLPPAEALEVLLEEIGG